MDLPRRDVIFDPLCHVATCIFTSQRQINIPLPRRDVYLSHRDVKLTSLCHVATCIFTSRRQFVNPSVTSRRVFSTSRREFAQASVTSRRGIPMPRRGLNPLSVTSRRCLQRRDVASNVVTLPSEALCHVATSPRTSRRDPVFSPRMVHFGPSPHTPSLIGTLAPCVPTFTRPVGAPIPPVGDPPLLTDHQCSPLSRPFQPVLGHSGISTTMYSTLAWV